MVFDSTSAAEVFQRWEEWEKSNNFYMPELEEKSTEEYLANTVERLDKEVDEALEVASIFEDRENADLEEFDFDYTEAIEREYDSRETQLKDELGYELADITIFTLKLGTAFENIFLEEDLSLNYQELHETLDHDISEPSDGPTEILETIGQPESYSPKEVNKFIENTVEELNSLTAYLDRSLLDYTKEKILFNYHNRNREDVDTGNFLT